MTSEGEPKKTWSIGPGWRMLMAGACVVMLAIGLWVWQSYAPPPPSDRPREVASLPARNKSVPAVERVDTCSVPDLERGVPQVLPGLETVRVGWYASLTDDLCTIAFDKFWPNSPHHGLYLADRPSVSSPFSEPQVIRSVGDAAGLGNKLAQLSPDGLELIFARGNQFFRCQRASRSAEFGDPAVWLPPDAAGAGRKLIMSRFLGPLRVLVSAENLNAGPRYSFFIVERADPHSEFGPPKEILLGNRSWPQICLRPNLLLGYYGGNQGISRQVRESEQEPFGDWERVFNAAVCGAVPGAVWVAPRDDVVFYCSPGPGSDPAGPKYIWMIRF